MRGALADLLFAARSLRRSPRFVATAIAILALGIGANTAIFSLVDAILLRPLPAVGDASRLVNLVGENVSLPQYWALRDGAARTLALAAQSERLISLQGPNGDARMATGMVVSENYFDVLRVRPALGRFFLRGENEASESVAVLSHAAWTERFGADPGVLGRRISVNGAPVTVVGVTPPGFRGESFGVFPGLWVPLGTWPRLATGPLASLDVHSRNWGWLSVFGRLSDGAPAAPARAALITVLERDAASHGERFEPGRWSVLPALRFAAGAREGDAPGRALGILFAAVLGALLIACANLANLLLARAAGREREIALRLALGATPRRIARQVLAESLLLSAAGAAAGVLVAAWTLGALARVPLMEGLTLSLFEPRVGWHALAFAASLAALVGVAFGVLPALAAARGSAAGALASSSPTLSPRSAARSVLVAAQVALCLALLVASGLLARSLASAWSIDLGLSTANVTLARVQLGLARYDEPRALAFLEEATDRLERRPGIEDVSWTSPLPLAGGNEEESFEAQGVPRGPDGQNPVADFATAGPGCFRTLGIPVLEGREFATDDRAGRPPVAVVNRAMVRRFFGGASPVGRTVSVSRRTATIVGVVGDARSASLTDPAAPQIWVPVLQTPSAALSGLTLAVRAKPEANAATAIREEIRSLDRSLPLEGVESFDDVVRARLFPQRLGAQLLGVFGALSLVLAAVGIYAVVSWSTRTRTREFGIRLALGARGADLRRLVLGRLTAAVGGGLLAGGALGAVAGRLLSGALYGVSPIDPPTFAAAAAVIAGAALLAAAVPARRAARTDPMTALRSE
ncbi:MAG TPA: ADOP family duplicated permease [Thermoanaerobaculia bacterium]|jgi:predicted permease|nr:ADOP family duplicated permease [Thermoanaerobaculia bacterium]